MDRSRAASDTDADNYVLIEGPSWGDAEFLGKWLVAAAEAEGFWREAYADPVFHKQVEHVCASYIPDFGISASLIVMGLKEYRTTLLLELSGEDGEDFTMMFAMGFFRCVGDRYRMALPSSLTAGKVRSAVLRYALTEDRDYALHPGRIVIATLSFAEERARQDRLRAVEQFHSCFTSLGTA
jgi:hypothetical protein